MIPVSFEYYAFYKAAPYFKFITLGGISLGRSIRQNRKNLENVYLVDGRKGIIMPAKDALFNPFYFGFGFGFGIRYDMQRFSFSMFPFFSVQLN